MYVRRYARDWGSTTKYGIDNDTNMITIIIQGDTISPFSTLYRTGQPAQKGKGPQVENRSRNDKENDQNLSTERLAPEK